MPRRSQGQFPSSPNQERCNIAYKEYNNYTGLARLESTDVYLSALPLHNKQ